MGNRKAEITYYLKYHYIFGTARCRCIFSDPEIRQAAENKIQETCRNSGLELDYIECNGFVCVAGVNGTPKLSANTIAKIIKSSVTTLKEQYPDMKKMQHVWQSDYYVSVDEPSGVELMDYAKTLMRRYGKDAEC